MQLVDLVQERQGECVDDSGEKELCLLVAALSKPGLSSLQDYWFDRVLFFQKLF